MCITNQLIKDDCMNIMKLFPNNWVQLTLTDIPYGEVSKNGEKRSKYKGQLRNLDKGISDIFELNLDLFLEEIYRVTKGSIYIFCGIEQISQIFKFYKDKKDCMVRHCVWKKTNPSPLNGQHMWLSSFENCIFIKKRKTIFNGKYKPSVWEFSTASNKIHPTQKSLNLFKYLIETSSNKGDIVFDPCMGSGTTCLAARMLSRQYIGIEKEEEYFLLAHRRIENEKNKL